MAKPNVGILATKDWVTSLINKVIKKDLMVTVLMRKE